MRNMKHVLMMSALIVMAALGLGFGPAQQAYAGCASCARMAHNIATKTEWPETRKSITEHITDSFTRHRNWMQTTRWDGLIMVALKGMADELSAVSIHQAFVIGTFFDAKQQLEAQQALQKIKARAHKDYHPSTGMCSFGSVSKSLAASEHKTEYNAIVLSQRSQDRNLGAPGTPGAAGQDADLVSRIDQFKITYCDPMDNNGGLSTMCEHDNGIGTDTPERMNKDIDYARSVDAPWTLDIDFTDATVTPAEEDIFALASNLFGHKIARPQRGILDGDTDAARNAQDGYMELRSLLAKRSVAENSFNAIIAQKSAGLAGSKSYMKAVLVELGVPGDETLEIIGENPSYYAQMEVLTKKLYQTPDFYTNLYDKPANVARKKVAIQAISLMQKFDLFKSYLRNEASLAVLLEMHVQDLQDAALSPKGGVEPKGLISSQ